MKHLAALLSGLWIMALLCSMLVRFNKGPKSVEYGLRGMGWGFGVGALIAWNYP